MSSLLDGTGKTIAELMALAVELSAMSDTPELDVSLLLCECLGKPRSFLYVWPDRCLSPDQQQHFAAMFARRLGGEPIAHILGHREFWSLPLEVSADTLIPRPDTECLVEKALALVADRVAGRALDLGTGTGAIALALASELPTWEFFGVDCVAAAVELARRNAQRLGLSNARFFQSDWFEAVATDERFDLIVSNPPYIDAADAHLDQGDVRFEPRSALVAEQSGLADLQTLVNLAPDFLNPDGVLVLEHGYDQAEAVMALLTARGFSDVGSAEDYGGNPRISWGCWRCAEINCGDSAQENLK